MSGYIGKSTNRNGTLAGSRTQAEREAMWGEIDGEIVDFNPSAQTATVRPLHRPVHNGEEIEMPDLLEVPVNFPRAGKGATTSPIVPGDRVRLRPKMRASERFHADGDATTDDWTRSFHPSDFEAFIEGGNSASDPIKNFDPDNHHLRFNEEGTYGIRGSKSGQIAIEGCEGNVYRLVKEAVDLCGDGFALLGTEPQLAHASQYTAIASNLKTIAGKLEAMAL